MRLRGGCQLAALIGTAAVVACQSGPDGSGDVKPGSAPPAAAAEAEPAAIQPTSAVVIDWASAGDCKAQLQRLLEVVEDGSAIDPKDVPFAVLVQPATGQQSWLGPSTSYLRTDLPIPVHKRLDGKALSAPCLIEVGPAHDVDVEQQVMGTEEVRSAYQTGTRSENNPEYDVARERVRQAERRLKDSESGVLQVGDPLLDLVGLLVGGMLTGLDEYGEEEELDRALAELAETPRKIDRPKYRAYHFERTTLRAGKAAVIPVTLIDRKRERSWRVELRQRELREFHMLEGLDPRDRHYEQHREGSMTRAELDRWSRQAPPIDLSTAVSAILDSSPETLSNEVASGRRGDRSGDGGAKRRAERTRAPDRSGAEGTLRQLKGPQTATPDAPGPFAVDYRSSHEQRGVARAADRREEDERAAGVVGVTAGDREGTGVYVDRYLVLTSYQLVQGTTVIDVSTFDGETVPGLLASADSGRDLALVQVPRTGRPVAWRAGPRLPQATLVEVLFGDRAAKTARLGPDGASIRINGDDVRPSRLFGAPAFLGAEAIGMIAALGDAGGQSLTLVSADSIARFLEREQVTIARH